MPVNRLGNAGNPIPQPNIQPNVIQHQPVIPLAQHAIPVQPAAHDPALASALSDKLAEEPSSAASLSPEELVEDIEEGFVIIDGVKSELELVKSELEKLEKTTKNSTAAQATADAVKTWVADTVLKKGSSVAQTALPVVIKGKDNILKLLGPAGEIINFVADIVDLGSGLGGVIRQSQILDLAFKELEALKKRDPPLDTIQLARLEKLEKELRFEADVWYQKSMEICIGGFTHAISYGKFGLSWAVQNPFIKALIGVGDASATGIGAVLAGYHFSVATDNLNAHREWAKEFREYVKKQSPVFTLDKTPRQIDKKVKQLYNENKLETVKENYIKIKTPELTQFLNRLNLAEETAETFKKKLEEQLKLADPFDEQCISDEEAENLFTVFKEIQNDEGVLSPLSSDQKDQFDAVKKKQVEEFLTNLIEHQHVDNFLVAYVNDRIEEKMKIKEMLDNRHMRFNKQHAEILAKIDSKEIDINTVHNRIINFKVPTLDKFLSELNLADETPLSLRDKLYEKFGTVVDPKTAYTIYVAYRNLNLAKEQLNAIQAMKGIIKNYDENLNIAKNGLEAARGEIQKVQPLLKDMVRGWIEKQSLETLVSAYVDYHAVLDPTIKHSVAKMVEKKHEIEKSFLKMKKTASGINFTAASIIFGVSMALAIIALVANPFAGAALILTVLSVGSTVLGIGLMGAGYYQAYKQRPGLTEATLKGAYIRLKYYQIRSTLSGIRESIAELLKKANQARRDVVAKIIQKLSPVTTLSAQTQEKSLEAEKADTALDTEKQKVEESVKKSQLQSEIWKAKADALENELQEITWKDFADQAKLKVAAEQSDQLGSAQDDFDTLNVLSHLLADCDFSLLSPETKKVIEEQMGINIPLLEEKLNEAPGSAVIVKKMVRDFFNMNEDAFVQFTTKQRSVRYSA